MKKFKKMISVLIVMAMLALPMAGLAATTNPSPGSPGYIVMPFTINGQRTATVADVIQFNMPFPATLISVQATARASGGTTPTLTLMVEEAGVDVLSAVISITAGTVSFGTISDSAIADEAAITIDLVIGGTSPTWDDITVVLVFKRK